MKPILLILLFLYSHIAFSQGVVVAADKMNVLYIGLENPMSIAAENYSCKDLVVEISQGTITRDEDNSCSYAVKVTTPGRAIITVKNKRGKILEEVIFRAKRAPYPVVKVAGKSDGLINKNVFRVQKGLIVEFENMDIDIKLKIISFDVTFYDYNKNHFFSETNQSAVFNNRIKEMINNIEDGDVVWFDNIKVTGLGGTIIKLPSIAFKIVDTNKLIDGNILKADKNILQLCCEFSVDSNCTSEKQRQFLKFCNCTNIDFVKGNIENNKRIGWWDYFIIEHKDTIIARREYYNSDTLKQEFYKEGIKTKEQTYVNGELLGDYLEYYSNGKIKIKGLYALGLASYDTIHVIDPITLEEDIEVSTNYSTVKSGTWQYFNEASILIKEEKYLNGVLVE